VHLAGQGRVSRSAEEDYEGLGSREQAALLRDVAAEGARRFGLEVRSVELVRHEFNTTFRVDDADGGRAAVRVHTNSMSTPAHVVAQHAWMRALAEDTDARLPVPFRTPSGDELAIVGGPGGRSFVVVAASWLEGDDVGECDVEQARALGRLMASMHAHAETWTLPTGGHLSRFTDPYFGDEERLCVALADRPEEAALVAWARSRCEEAMARAERAAPPHVVHGDLHGGNLKWHDGTLSVFDFDDCGIASPALDLAIAVFYQRGSDPAVERALRTGYGEVRPLPDVDDADAEALVAARQLLLANDLLQSSTEHLRAMAGQYVHRSLVRLAHWRESGRFVLDPPQG
jgi:Ser/Thr protein kinase RdoA (MazF antagonist)